MHHIFYKVWVNRVGLDGLNFAHIGFIQSLLGVSDVTSALNGRYKKKTRARSYNTNGSG